MHVIVNKEIFHERLIFTDRNCTFIVNNQLWFFLGNFSELHSFGALIFKSLPDGSGTSVPLECQDDTRHRFDQNVDSVVVRINTISAGQS